MAMRWMRDSRLRGNDGKGGGNDEKGVGSRFAGMTLRLGTGETGRVAPRLWRLRAEWIPAYAGMTVRRTGMTEKRRA